MPRKSKSTAHLLMEVVSAHTDVSYILLNINEEYMEWLKKMVKLYCMTVVQHTYLSEMVFSDDTPYFARCGLELYSHDDPKRTFAWAIPEIGDSGCFGGPGIYLDPKPDECARLSSQTLTIGGGHHDPFLQWIGYCKHTGIPAESPCVPFSVIEKVWRGEEHCE